MILSTTGRLLRGATIVSALAGCSNTETMYPSVTIGPGGTPALLTTADLRVVTDRPSPTRLGQRVVCAEPPPDVAKALSTSAQAAIAVTSQASVNGQASGSYATAEQLAALAGRVPALLALRDGLFRACEAYANGIIGDSSYALLLSRYGEILVTVVLADAASSSAGSTLATLTGLNLTKPASGDGADPAHTGGSSAPAPATKKADAAALPITGPVRKRPGMVRSTRGELGGTGARVELAQAAGDPARAAEEDSDALKVSVKLPAGSSLSCMAPAGTDPIGVLDCSLIESTLAGAKATPVAAAAKPAAAADTGPAVATAAASTASALQQMQQSYLGMSVAGPLLVACISEYDPTRPGHWVGDPPREITNELLRNNCDMFLRALNSSESKAADNVRQIQLLGAKAALAAAQRAK